MPAIVIEGIPPWDDRYEFDDWAFTNRELYRIKEISKGIRAAELIEALDANDTAAFVALAIIVLERNGKQIHDLDINQFWDAKVGAITLDLSVSRNGDSADPPTLPSSEEGPAGSESSSGEDSASDGG